MAKIPNHNFLKWYWNPDYPTWSFTKYVLVIKPLNHNDINLNDTYLLIILDTLFNKHHNHLNIYLEIVYFPVVEVKYSLWSKDTSAGESSLCSSQ